MKREDVCLTLLFGSVPIENHIFSLLHIEGVRNIIIYPYFEWIISRIEPLHDNEVDKIYILTQFLIE